MHLGDFVVGVARVLDRLTVVPVAEPRIKSRDRRRLDIVVSDGAVRYALWNFFAKFLPRDDALEFYSRVETMSVFSIAHLVASAACHVSTIFLERNIDICLQQLPTDPRLRANVTQVFFCLLDVMLKTAAAEAVARRRPSLIIEVSGDSPAAVGGRPN